MAQVPLATVVRGIMPFIAADCVRMLAIALVPALATWLPSLIDR